MSKAGNYAAFKELNPTKEDFGQNIVDAENQQFKYREEERLNEAKEYERQEASRKEYKSDLEKQKLVSTGFEPLDKIYAKFYLDNMEKLGGNHRKMSAGGLSRSELDQLTYENTMLNKMPELIESVSKHATNFAKVASEGLKDGTLSKAALGQLNQVKALVEGKILDLRVVNGKPVATIVNDQGEKEEVDFGEVVQGFKFNPSTLTKRTDAEAYAKEKIEALGKRQVPLGKGGMVGVSQTFEPHRAKVSATIDGELGSVDDPNDLAISMWTDTMGKDMKDFGPEAMKEVKQHIMDRLETGYDQTFSGSQYRPPSTDSDNSTATERKQQQLGDSLYSMVHLAAQGDEQALGNLSGRSKRVGDNADGSPKYLTAKDAFIADGHIVIADGNGDALEKIPMNVSEGVRASRLLAWFSDGDPNESRNLYNMGKANAKGISPKAESVAESKVAEEVPATPTGVINTLNITDDATAMEHTFRVNFPEKTGFQFKGITPLWGKNKLKIIAPNGTPKTFDLDPNDAEGIKSSIKAWMDDNQVKKKTVYRKSGKTEKKVEKKVEKKATEPNPNDPLDLDL